jgi:hypothetical protein
MIAVAMICAATALEASAIDWLVGGAIGQAEQYDYSVGGPIDNEDDTDTAYRISGGARFHPNIGVTVSYLDLGEPSYDGPAFGGFTDELEATGWDFSVVAGLAPGQQTMFTVFGMVGLFVWEQDVHYVDPSGTYDYNEDGESLSYGGGLAFRPGGDGSPFAIHAAYQYFQDVGDEDNSGHEYDRSLFEFGVDYLIGKRRGSGM